jgi:NAD(P)-dependent dehydrogenase (short-subunit alcohol dehydrogenase family)
MEGFATYPSLRDKAVFITGAASGIGAVMARAFHEQGAKVAFIDLQAEEGEALAGELGAWFRPCDVTDAQALQQAVTDAAAALGGLDVLVNNVANDTRRAAADTSPEAWRQGLAINLDPAFIASAAAYPLMKAGGGGAIINLSSINALLGPADLSNYVAAKGAINALSKSLAREWGADAIRVNAVSPGWVVTPRQLALWLTPQAEAEWMKQVALQRRIEPHDIARLALFLAADDSRMITGQNLVIDGGRV